MYETAYGPRYKDLKALTGSDYPSAAAIAKLIRADIKKGVATGDLPATFAGYEVTYAVTVDNYSGGRSIDIEVRGVPEAVRTEDKDLHGHGYTNKVDTDDAKTLLAKLKSYHWAYNYDGSDSMTDYYHVNYGGAWPKFESDWSAADRVRKNAKAKAAKANPKPKKPSKLDLIRHLRDGHHVGYRDTNRLDLLLSIHALKHGQIDDTHDHAGDNLLPKVTADA
jgi:hypothetical protein